MFDLLARGSARSRPRSAAAIAFAVALHGGVLALALGVFARQGPGEMIVDDHWSVLVRLKQGPRPQVKPAGKPAETGEKKIHRGKPPRSHSVPRAATEAPAADEPLDVKAVDNASPADEVVIGNPGESSVGPSGDGDGDGNGNGNGSDELPCPVGATCTGAEIVYTPVGGDFTRPRPSQACVPPAPQVPNAAQQLGLEGRVIVSYVVHRDGRADTVRVLNPDAPAVFVGSVGRWLETCAFTPAQHAGEPVSVRVVQTFRFSLR